MDADRLRRLAIDGDHDALFECWRCNARAPRPMSRAVCGDYAARCAPGRPTLAELARRARVDLPDVEAELSWRLRRAPLRREVRAVLEVAIEASHAFGTRPLDEVLRILAMPELRNWSSGSGYDEPDRPRPALPCGHSPRDAECGWCIRLHGLLWRPWQETCEPDDEDDPVHYGLVLGQRAAARPDRCAEVEPDVGLDAANAHRAAVELTAAAAATARANLDGMRSVLLGALARVDPAQDE